MFSSRRDFLLSCYTRFSARHEGFWCECETQHSRSAIKLICHPHQRHLIKTVPGTPVLVCLFHVVVLRRKSDVLRMLMVVTHALIVAKTRRREWLRRFRIRKAQRRTRGQRPFLNKVQVPVWVQEPRGKQIIRKTKTI
jgi:hypothetical protein